MHIIDTQLNLTQPKPHKATGIIGEIASLFPHKHTLYKISRLKEKSSERDNKKKKKRNKSN